MQSIKFTTQNADMALMSAKWFVQKEDLVDGPLTAEDVQSRLQGGQLQPTHLIWGRGLEHWFSIKDWSADPNLISRPAEPLAPPVWHYALGGKSYGPLLRDDMVEELKDADSLGTVMLWTKGLKEWTPLFEFHDVLSDVGVNKREFPRADLTGKAILKIEGTTLVAPLVSISEGGFGIQLDQGISSGQIITVELHSPAFREVLNAKAEVRYAARGVIGMKFTQVSPEINGAIIQFVRQSQTRFALKAAA